MSLSEENKAVIEKAKTWFKETIIVNHIKNTEKLAKAKEFQINPLLAPYLSAFLTGSISEVGIAKALIYPRVLGTSITTSFGQNIQNFISEVLVTAFGTTDAGMDIVFTDHTDGRKKYAQLKLGPNTINKDDVESINGHFRDLIGRSKQNRVGINSSDLVIGVMYGTEDMLSGHYKSLRDEHHHDIYVGKDFWVRLTGDGGFFDALIQGIAEVLAEVNGSKLLQETIEKLAQDPEIKLLANVGRKK